MRCPKCGERVLKKSRIPNEGYVIMGKYVLVKSGSLIAACSKCGNRVELMSNRPTIVKVS